METDDVRNWIYQTVRNNLSHKFVFDDIQMEQILSEVIDKEIVKYYEEFFITEKECENMILHIACELGNKFPNSASFPKAPQPSGD